MATLLEQLDLLADPTWKEPEINQRNIHVPPANGAVIEDPEDILHPDNGDIEEEDDQEDGVREVGE